MLCRKQLYENKKAILAIPKELFLAMHSKKISFEIYWSMSIKLKRYQVIDIEAVFRVCRKWLYKNKKAVLAIPKEEFLATHSKKISFEMSWSMSIKLKRYQVMDIKLFPWFVENDYTKLRRPF